MPLALDIADAVVSELNQAQEPPAAGFGQTFTAVRAYRPVYDLADLKTLRVTVVPKGLEACTLTIERVLGQSRLPFVLVVSLEGRRILGPSHKPLGDFTVLPVDTAGVAHGG